MSLNDPSAIILIIGAIAILAFLVHGLWFSNKPSTRQLAKNNKKDQEIVKSQDVGKVRIVSTEESTKIKFNNYDVRQEPVMSNNESYSKTSVSSLSKEYVNNNQENIPVSHENNPWQTSYEINIVAPKDHPYKGEDIEEIANEYGFLYGDLNIYYVYENPEQQQNEVFRICSLKHPFSFPKNMSGYSTPAIALYMSLPPKGKGVAYFKAISMAANIFTERLGGVLQDNSHNIITAEILTKMGDALAQYDQS